MSVLALDPKRKDFEEVLMHIFSHQAVVTVLNRPTSWGKSALVFAISAVMLRMGMVAHRSRILVSKPAVQFQPLCMHSSLTYVFVYALCVTQVIVSNLQLAKYVSDHVVSTTQCACSPNAFIYNHGESPSDCGGLKTKEPSDDVGVVIACVASVITPGFRSWFSEHCEEFAFVFIDEIHDIYSDLYGPLHNAVATLIPRPDMRFVLASGTLPPRAVRNLFASTNLRTLCRVSVHSVRQAELQLLSLRAQHSCPLRGNVHTSYVKNLLTAPSAFCESFQAVGRLSADMIYTLGHVLESFWKSQSLQAEGGIRVLILCGTVEEAEAVPHAL